MKRTFFAFFLLLCITGCDAQIKRDNKDKFTNAETDQNKPQATWKVNKQYDSNGNLMRYDSTYSWSYSNKGGQQLADADSLMNIFNKQFVAGFPSFFPGSFGNADWNDSLYFHDFITPDFLPEKWESHNFDMKEIMSKMDTLRNLFLTEKHHGLFANPKM